MANTIGKFIKTGKNIFDHLDSKVNFSIPENIVSYQGINGKKDDRNLNLNQNNFRLQIGKMDKKGETIYTKELLLPAIEYIIKKTGKDEKAIIQLRPDLAKFLTNEDKKEESKQILSFEEEKQKIVQLIKKYFKNNQKNIEILNISQQYPEVFSILKEKGKAGLASIEKPILNKNNFSALNIAKYLYRLSQRNPKLIELFYNTKTSVQKANDIKKIGENQSDYYSLIEVSIRLYEVIKGISIQGGIDRQKQYDKIIGGILHRKDIDSFKIKDYPELEELHKLCLEINSDFTFDRLRIGTKDAEKVGKEFQEKTQKLSKLKAISLISSIALVSVLAGGIGGYQMSQNKQKKEKEKYEEMLSKDALNSSNISFYGTHTNREENKNFADKQKYLNDVAEHMYYYFCEVYGKPNEEQKETLIAIIKNELIKKKEGENSRNIEKFFNGPIDPSLIYQQDFLVKEIISNNEITLNSLGLNPIPYNQFLKYKSDFNKVLSTDGNLSLNSDLVSGNFIDKNTTNMKFIRKPIGGGYINLKMGYDMEYIGTYYDYKNYDYYHFVKLKSEDGNFIILASGESSYSFNMSGEHKFSLEIAKEGIQKIMGYRDKY